MAALNLQHRGFCCVGPFGYTPSGRSFTPRKKLPSKGNFTISDAWRRKTGARSKKKQKADVAAAAAAMGAKKVLGQHLVDETMLARVGADRGEEVSESLFVAIEWLIHGEWRAAGKPDDAAFYGARWFGQAALREVLGDGVFEKMVRDYAQLMIDLALKPEEEEDEEGEGEERDEDVEEGDEGAGVAGAAHGEDGEAGDVEVRCCRGRHCHCPCPCPDRHSHLDACRRR